MEINSKIPFIDVTYMTKELCKYINKEDYEVVRVPVTLKDNGEEKNYISLIACPKEEILNTFVKVIRPDDKHIDMTNHKYYYITTIAESELNKAIDFGKNMKKLYGNVNKEDYESVFIPVTVKENEKELKYYVVIMCPKKEILKTFEESLKSEIKTKEEYTINPNYCHIATFPEDAIGKEIDFDINSDSEIKANFNKEYEYVNNFFRRFINFRNKLIETEQVVKSDDIYQYFLSRTGFNQDTNKKHHKSK
ncbi:MAG: hypothetical protein IJI58_03275 [Bacilli bacterium]|nr:hypothetical protein [Bacilli bacterium]